MFKLILNLLLILSLSTFIVSCSNDDSSPTEINIEKDIPQNEIFSITPPHDVGQYQREPVWSKDGSNRLAFVWGDQLGGSGLHEIFLATYPEGKVEQLTMELGDTALCKHFPEWSADGSKIYYTFNNTISYIDVASKSTNILIDSVYTCYSIACSKDGLFLYFSGNVKDDQGLFKYTFSNSKLEKISNFYNNPISINPDGTKLAIGGSQLSIFDLAQFQVVKTHNIIVQDDRIEWSPSGKYITLNFIDSSKSIRILDVQQEAYLYIKIDSLNDLDKSWGCTWSHDGSILAFVGTQPGRTHTSIWGIKPNLN